MMTLMLYAWQQSQPADILMWVVGVAAVVAGAVMVVWQRRAGEALTDELAQLDKVKRRNVEYEFVLKAMRLSTWHIDPKTRAVAYDYDFRGNYDRWTPLPDGSQLDEGLASLHPDDASRVAQALDDICTGRTEDYHQQYRVQVSANAKTYWEESFAVVTERDADGAPTSIVGTSMRIDERKAMEEGLVAARNKAEESDRLKSAFIANMSHEIRTPLNAIIGFTSVLPDVADADERQRLIGVIQENNQKLLRIVDDVMTVAKIEAGSDRAELSTFDLDPLLAELADRYRPQAKPGVRLEASLGAAATVTTDRSRLQQIVAHYLSNALKFTSAGTVTLGYQAPGADRRLRLWVSDTGIGIAEADQQRVFDRFFKVDEFVPGAGLGLSVCSVMAASLGGTVGVESKPGQGSTFWVELPV